MKHNPHTICTQVPLTLLGAIDEKTASKKLTDMAIAGAWTEALDGPVDDNRVLWTFEDDHISVWFRRTPEAITAGR